MSDLRSLTPLPEVNDTAEAKEARDLTARLGRCTLGAIPRPPQIPAMPLFERLEDKGFWDENTTKDTAVAGASVNAEENHLPRSVHFADLEEAAEDATESPEPSTVELSVPSEQVQVSGDPLSDNTRTPRPRRRNEATYSDSSRRSTRDLVLQSRQNIEQQEPADVTHVAQARRKARHSVTPYDSVQRHPRKSILRPPRSSHCEPSPEIPLPVVLPLPNTLSNDEVSETSLGSVESKLNPITAMFKRLMDGLRAKGQVWKKPTVADPRLVNGRRPHEIAHTPTPSAFDDAPPQLAAESPHSSQEADTALDQSPPALESHPLRSITHIERSMDDLDSSVDEVAMTDVSGQMDSDGRNSWSPHSSSQCSVWGPSTFTRSDAPLESSTWNTYREPFWGSPAAFSQSSSYREDSRLNGEEDAMDVDDW
ncbi:hypothetical protein SISNIDRAFT_346693 [Sistotremastrum niveocremeum HHB9708]|uniref:Uncharacterized protein n=1 Tax=Sistotremastrum niveocremeum HHB9708 TaxID=1314777 RepID=A0A164WUI9_9AGAM|nr:hypothetical protein SISNIDRAFT_346693 [Sistotremastrum niveocremeum HHB9708]